MMHSVLSAKLIIDDYGRSVEVPNKVKTIYSASSPLSMSLLAFDADIIAALTSPFSKEQKPYVGSAFDKKVVGGVGGGRSINYEVLAGVKPDVAIIWGGMSGAKKIAAKFEALHIPILLVRNATIDDLISQFRLYGELTGNRKRADKLIAYTQETLHLVKNIQSKLAQKNPKRYYFAEGIEGLHSECEGSFHLEPFLYAGAQNALECQMSSNYGMEKITAEEILLANPDVIIAMEEQFYKNIANNPRFASLDAVKNKEVYLVPSEPFNYITRPPSFMRFLGIRWLISIFHRELLPEGAEAEKERFFKLFFPSFSDNSLYQ